MRVTPLVVLALSLLAAASASAGFLREREVPQDTREFFVDESKLSFDEIPGLPSTRLWGIEEGAGFRIEVPEGWSGNLVAYAHGYRGPVDELTVDSPPLPLRIYLLQHGYAWVASSYSKNYYDVRAGVESTNSLVRYFKANVGEPDQTFITGFSMGGHVIGAAIEQAPNFKCPTGRFGHLCRRLATVLGKLTGGVKWDGAAPFCGAMGDEALFDYFGDFAFAAPAIAGVETEFPPPDDYQTSVLQPTLAALYVNPEAVFSGNGSAAIPTALGERLRALTVQISGGDRPYANTGFAFFQQLLFGLTGSDGTIDGIVSGNLFDNTRRVYQLDGDPALSAEEIALNDAILRVARDPDVNPPQLFRVSRIPRITGRLSIPVVSTHTLGDLFVPFAMEQIYATEARHWGRDDLLVSRATRAIGHCEFSPEEIVESFDDMIQWVETGVRPAGDEILDPEIVADPLFGCQFSRGTTQTRPFGAACPE